MRGGRGRRNATTQHKEGKRHGERRGSRLGRKTLKSGDHFVTMTPNFAVCEITKEPVFAGPLTAPLAALIGKDLTIRQVKSRTGQARGPLFYGLPGR